MNNVACEMAVREFNRTIDNVQRFWQLLYAVAAALAVTLIVFLISLIFGNQLIAITTGVSSVLGGGGLVFLGRLKNQAIAEHEKAKLAVRKDCSNCNTIRGSEEETMTIEQLVSAFIDNKYHTS